jgi:hypothetical protein
LENNKNMNKIKFVTRHKGGGGGGTTTVQSIPDWARPYVEKTMGTAQTQYEAGNLGEVAGTSNLQNQAFTTGAQGINTATGLGLGTAASGIDTLQAQQARLENMAMAPSPETLAAQKADIVYGAQKSVAGLNTGFGNAGSLGSARQAVMQGAQNAETVGKLAQVDADYENKMFQNRLQAEGVLGTSVAGAGGLATTGANIATGGASALSNLGGQQRTIEQQQADSDWQALNRYASTIYGTPARQSAVAGAPGGK